MRLISVRHFHYLLDNANEEYSRLSNQFQLQLLSTALYQPLQSLVLSIKHYQ